MRIYKRKQIIERITIIGSMAEVEKWINWCYDNGYRVTQTGPKPIARYKFDSTKFKMIAEKRIKRRNK